MLWYKYNECLAEFLSHVKCQNELFIISFLCFLIYFLLLSSFHSEINSKQVIYIMILIN